MKSMKKLVAVLPSTEQLVALGNMANALRSAVPELITLTTAEKRATPTIGTTLDPVCRQLLNFMSQNQHMVPPSVDVNYAQAGQAVLEVLRQVIPVIDVVSQQLHDTEHGIGAYVRAVAMEGYNQLKRSGEAQGQRELLREIRAHFAKGKRLAKAVDNPPATEPAATAG